MFSCSFIVSYKLLKDIDSFFDSIEINNSSIFEYVDLGFSEDLDENGFPISNFFKIEILAKDKNESKNLENLLISEFNDNIKDFIIKELIEQDWVDSYKKELKPILCDKFYLYNDSIQTYKPESQNLIPIKLNSALAFGSGNHETTKGCLLNIIFLEKLGFNPDNILDMGSGTGVLGICASKVFDNYKLIGVDIDKEATKVTKENYILNEIEGEVFQSDNIDFLKKEIKFDLILCNILKQPLLDLANSFFENLKKDGYIIISGFISSQSKEIIDFYQEIGFKLENNIMIEDWHSILLKKT